MISVVCIYNNKEILDNYLLKSLKNQTINYELILIDNTQERFKSAAEALNYGGNNANGEYIMFLHQDVDLCSNTWIEEVEKVLDKLPNLGVAGLAGGSEDRRGVITNRLAGEIQIKNPTKVQTVDECLVITPKSVFDMLRFDEEVCDDWHLYAVDYCLSVKILGFDAYVLPCYIHHRSAGYSFSEKYYLTLKKVLKKHKKRCKWIYTTCGDWDTSFPLGLQRTSHLAKGVLKLLFKKL
jgi:glycosyltransferase involved in cell wall biosynthesis